MDAEATHADATESRRVVIGISGAAVRFCVIGVWCMPAPGEDFYVVSIIVGQAFLLATTPTNEIGRQKCLPTIFPVRIVAFLFAAFRSDKPLPQCFKL
jgi:hypothetical protein